MGTSIARITVRRQRDDLQLHARTGVIGFLGRNKVNGETTRSFVKFRSSVIDRHLITRKIYISNGTVQSRRLADRTMHRYHISSKVSLQRDEFVVFIADLLTDRSLGTFGILA